MWCARDIVGDEPFALLLPDMIMQAEKSCTRAMVELYQNTGGNIIGVQECNPAETHKYGIVGRGDTTSTGFEITGMVEKPKPEAAPVEPVHQWPLHPPAGDLRAAGKAGTRCRQRDPAHRRDAQADGESIVLRLPFQGRTFDCGAPDGFVEANVAFALSRPDIYHQIADFLRALVDEMKPAEQRSAS